MGFNWAFKGLMGNSGFQLLANRIGTQVKTEINRSKLTSFIHSFISIQPLGRFWQEPEPSQGDRYGSGTLRTRQILPLDIGREMAD
jgi:hypothetical protein